MNRILALALCLILALALSADAGELDDAIFAPETREEAETFLEEGTGVLLIGDSEDTATRSAAEAIITLAEDAGLAQVHYISKCPESRVQSLAEYALKRGTSFANVTGDEALLQEAAAGNPHGILVFVINGAFAGIQAAPAGEAADHDQELNDFTENVKRYLDLIASSPCPGHC
jgi:hypothetical protein